MKGSERVLAVLIAGTLVAGVVGVFVRDTTPDNGQAITTPTPTVTTTTSPTQQGTPTVSPTPTEIDSPSPSPSPTRTRDTEVPPTPETGVGTSVVGALLLIGAALAWRERRRAF